MINIDGDASETGIIRFFEKIEDIEKTRIANPLHKSKGGYVQIPFNSDLKFACYVRKVPKTKDDSSNFWIAFKGAPERILERCSTYLLEGKEFKKDKLFEDSFIQANKNFALKGERVLGLAYAKLDSDKYPLDFNFINNANEDATSTEVKPNYPISNLCFVGLIAMEDPPRAGVKQAIAMCKSAGIKVIMVTGDQPLTAASIAFQIGIIENLNDTPQIIKQKMKLKTLDEAEKFSNVNNLFRLSL